MGVEKPEQDDTEARMRAMGIAVMPGEDFPCILPCHENHVASVRRAPAGYFEYRCEQLGASLGLPQVRASRAHDEVRRPEAALAHAWRARLDYESGLCQPLSFMLELPERLPEYAVRFARGVQLYVGLLLSPRWPEDFLFTRDFAQGWCALTDQQARMGQRAAERHGVLIRVGWKGLPKGRAILWRPGPALTTGDGPS